MKKQITSLLFVLILLSIALITITNYSQVSAHGGRNNECLNGINVESGTGDEKSYQSTANTIITGLCIKAGNSMFEDGHSEIITSNGITECYDITGIGTEVITITRQENSSSCKELSHIDVYIDNNIETITPSPTRTPLPTISITPTIIATSSGGLTPTITPTTENAENNDDASNNSQNDSDNIGGSTFILANNDTSQTQNTGDILGASTLASTGFTINMFTNMLFIIGLIICLAPTMISFYSKNNN
ncbi:hypothetical protein ACFL1P_00700 [Patescibacteria group bacterium]